MTMLAHSVLELGQVAAAARGVGLSIDAPGGASRRIPSSRGRSVRDLLVGWCPVSGRGDRGRHFRALWSQGQGSWLGRVGSAKWCLGSREISTDLCWVEKRWVVDKLVANHCVHALGWNLVVSKLHGLILALIIIWFETVEIFQNWFSIWLLVSHVLVVVPLERVLSWLEHWVWLITGGNRWEENETYPYDLNPAYPTILLIIFKNLWN